MDKTTSYRKVGTFRGLFFAKERGKSLKVKPDGKFQVEVFAVRQIGAALDVPTARFYDHIIV